MSDEHEMPEDFDVVNFEQYAEDDEAYEQLYEEEYEDIDAAEIDAVVNVLNDLIDKVKSQTIKDYLEATCSDIACLMEELDEDEAEEDPQAEAA